MLKLADLEKEYMVSCAHCAKPMPAWELFCPSCNGEQSPAEPAGDASASARFEDSAFGATESAASGVIEPARPQEDWESIDSLVTTTAANEELAFGLGHIRPGVVRQDAAPVASGPLPLEGAGKSIDLRRVALGVAATLVVLLLFALLHDTFVLRRDAEVVKAPVSAPGRANAAPSRPAAAPEPMATVEAPPPEQAGKDKPPPGAVVTAIQALGLGEAAAAPPAPGPLPEAAPTVAIPVPESGATDSTDRPCSGAAAALALCQK